MGAARDAGAIRRAFETTYERKYGHVEINSPIEFVGLVLTASGRIERPNLIGLRPVIAGPAPRVPERRLVHFGERTGRIETPVLRRDHLPIGHAASGPAIIEEYGSTTVVGPDDRFEIGTFGEIRIQCA